MTKFLPWISVIILLGLSTARWWSEPGLRSPVGHCCGTGRLVAKVVPLRTPQDGRLARLLANDGDAVTTGQVVGRLDCRSLEEALAQAQGSLHHAQAGAEAIKKNMEQGADTRNTLVTGSSRQENIALARTEQAAWQEKIIMLRSQLFDAQAAVIAAHNTTERLRTEIAACTVRSPMPGIVVRHMAQEGDLLSKDATLLHLMDLREVVMRFTLPADKAVRIAIGAEVRVMLDTPSSVVLPAQVAFIAPAENTFSRLWTALRPQSQPQREVLAKIAPEIIVAYAGQIIDGVSGRAYVQLDRHCPWPEALQLDHRQGFPGNTHNSPLKMLSTFSIPSS